MAGDLCQYGALISPSREWAFWKEMVSKQLFCLRLWNQDSSLCQQPGMNTEKPEPWSLFKPEQCLNSFEGCNCSGLATMAFRKDGALRSDQRCCPAGGTQPLPVSDALGLGWH